METWQTALRKQYFKRDPLANPLGPEPFHEALDTRYRSSSLVKDTLDVERDTNSDAERGTNLGSSVPPQESQAGDIRSDVQGGLTSLRDTPDADVDVRGEVSDNENGLRPQEGKQNESDIEEPEESKDWLDLPMLAKLESMHLLTEWQFQNPTRLRSIMKSDGDGAEWVGDFSFTEVLYLADVAGINSVSSLLDMTPNLTHIGSLGVNSLVFSFSHL